jgi:predicted ArsR family transcriptional regulator
MLTKTQVRKTIGRGKFTSVEAAEALEVSRPTARRTLRALVEAGVIEALDEHQKVTDEDGEAQRGRPRQVFRVAKGK